MVALPQRGSLSDRHEVDLAQITLCGCHVEQSENKAVVRAPVGVWQVDLACRYEAEREQQALDIPAEGFSNGAPRDVAVVCRAVGLEQAPDECCVDLAVVRVENGIRNVCMPTLAAVLGRRRELREATRLPPQSQRHRVERDLGVTLCLRDRGIEAGVRRAEIVEPLD